MADGPPREPQERRRRRRTPAGIPYSTVEAVAADLHGIGEDGLAALRARLHSLRRLDFPNGVSGSSGRHFAYGLADLLAVLAALELAEAYLPPAAAVAIVREGWPEIARCALHGLDSSGEPGFATIHPNALFQALNDGKGSTSQTLHVEVASMASAPNGGRSISMAAGSLSRRTMDALRRIDDRSHDLALGQVAEIRARFGDARPLPRPATSDGRLLSDGPYWPRARALTAALANGSISEDERRRATWQLGYLVRPAPIEAWKTRVEVHPGLDDVGYAAALATLAHQSGVRNARVALPTDDAERIWRRMTAIIGDRPAVVARLDQVAHAGEETARAARQQP